MPGLVSIANVTDFELHQGRPQDFAKSHPQPQLAADSAEGS